MQLLSEGADLILCTLAKLCVIRVLFYIKRNTYYSSEFLSGESVLMKERVNTVAESRVLFFSILNLHTLQKVS